MNLDSLKDEILDHPQAMEVVQQVQIELKNEQKGRIDFREWLNDDVKAEYINGEIVMHSPVKRGHLIATKNLFRLLSVFVEKNDLGEVDSEKALIGLTRNDYEPDIVFWNKKTAKNFHDETMVHPVPQLVVEVLSKGTKGKDRGVKFTDYAAHQIPEYWIVDYKNQTVEQYVLPNNSDKEYSLLHKLKLGQQIESQIIKGFKIPVDAIFDKKANLKALTNLLK